MSIAARPKRSAASAPSPAVVRRELMERVYEGRVLDANGVWVPIEQWAARKDAMLKNLSRGLVLVNDEWKPLAYALERQPRRQPAPPHDSLPDTAVETRDSARAAPDATPSEPQRSFAVKEQRRRVAVAGQKETDALICTFSGSIDQQSAVGLQSLFESIERRGIRFIIADFSGISSVVSAGWGIFVAEAQRLKNSGGRLLMCGFTAEVAEAFELLEFGRIIERRESADSCVAALGEKKNRSNASPDASDASAAPRRASAPRATPRQPLPERISKVIAENGPGTLLSIKRHLARTQYGGSPVSLFGLYRTLKEMNLHTKSRRQRFYRSC